MRWRGRLVLFLGLGLIGLIGLIGLSGTVRLVFKIKCICKAAFVALFQGGRADDLHVVVGAVRAIGGAIGRTRIRGRVTEQRLHKVWVVVQVGLQPLFEPGNCKFSEFFAEEAVALVAFGARIVVQRAPRRDSAGVHRPQVYVGKRPDGRGELGSERGPLNEGIVAFRGIECLIESA